MSSRSIVAVAIAISIAPSARSLPSVTITPGTELAITELEFTDPEMDDSGLLAVMARTHHAPGLPCASPVQRRIVVMDLTSTCGQDVLREKPGLGTDPAVSGNGTVMAWRTEEPGAHRFFVGPTDFTSEVEAMPADAATATKALQLSPDGTQIVYWRVLGGVDQIVRRPALSASPIVVLDQGDSIIVNDRHPMADDGTVFYSKLVGSRHELRMALPGQLGGTPVPGAWTSDDKRQVASSADGNYIAYIGTHDGVENVYWLLLNSDRVQLTFNDSPAVRIFDLDISRDGEGVVFSSNGDFTGGNADGSVEVFKSARIYTMGTNATIVQLTNLSAPFPTRVFLKGFSTNGIGDSIIASWGDFTGSGFEPCTAADHRTARVRLLPWGPPPPSFVPTNAMVMPPFDILTQDPGFSLGCTATGPSETTCTTLVRESTEGSRNLLIMSRWDVPACDVSITTTPRLVTLPMASQAVVSAELSTPPGCAGQPATFTMIAVSPDVAVADRATASVTFTLPP